MLPLLPWALRAAVAAVALRAGSLALLLQGLAAVEVALYVRVLWISLAGGLPTRFPWPLVGNVITRFRDVTRFHMVSLWFRQRYGPFFRTWMPKVGFMVFSAGLVSAS